MRNDLAFAAVVVALLAACGPDAQPCPVTPATPPAALPPVATAASAPAEDEYVKWLEARSMLAQAEAAAKKYSATGKMWQHPYPRPRPRAASAMATVWVTRYPASTIT